MLLTASMAAYAADATGYVPFQCPYTGWSHLHLQKLKGRQLGSTQKTGVNFEGDKHCRN